MADVARLARTEPVRVARSRTRWALEIGRLRVEITRTREAHTVGVPATGLAARPASFWPVVAGTFVSVSAFALVVFGARATQRPPDRPRYIVSVAVPAAPHVAETPRRRPAIGREAPPMEVQATARDSHFDFDEEPHVAAAMRTGELQEWLGDDGQRRFLTAGPASAEGDRRCRDLALLTRLAEGGSHVRALHRCTTATVGDPPAAEPDVAEQAASGDGR